AEAEAEAAIDASQSDPLDDALAEFDKQLMEDIPSFANMNDAPEPVSTFDDSMLKEVENFSLEPEVDGELPAENNASKTFDELEDLPGLDDWLSEDNSDDHALLDELEQADFDDLLGKLDDGESSGALSEPDMSFGNPDLDLAALLTDPEEAKTTGRETVSEDETGLDADDGDSEEYLDVETLMDDGGDDGYVADDNTPLDLDVSLSEFSGVSDDEDVIDIDKDAGQSANLDLARVYIEMDDHGAAKELLEEVIEKGSDDQKEEATALLNQLQAT
ncbi:FimV/HubP family polar landmark protein, partial [Aestuariibacter sp. A3R04]|uniref:FimV/HubP family polar landmark protein n=1 Tax=Aestuariibacter sp. A3R04 TaxID=2841571 RepID=UPI0027381AE2